MSREAILDSIMDAVGETPMVKLSRIGRDLPCELLGKCEFMNPGGSIKDRMALHIIEKAEREGSSSIQLDSTFIDYPIVYEVPRTIAAAVGKEVKQR